MLNVHVVTSLDQTVQETANRRVVQALLETKTWDVGLITASAHDHAEQENLRGWAKNLAQALREAGIHVNVCGATMALCPRTKFATEQMAAIEAARARRAERGEVDLPQRPVECEPDHTLGVVRRISGACDAVIAIYGRDQILAGLEHRGIRINPESLSPGSVVVERDHGEYLVY